jgi:hypothetical protein
MILEDLQCRAFSTALSQDIINSITPTERNDTRYGREDLRTSEIEKVNFLITVVDDSTKEELDEYISELSQGDYKRYENNKNIVEKYKDYVCKTLYMIEEKDIKIKNDNQNIMTLQAELIKTNTLLQAFSRFEQRR